jgi:hypothetical protein
MAAAIPWTDYVGAWGSIAAILVALIGLVVAVAAWLEASDSAAAAWRSSEAAVDTARSSEQINEASQKTLDAATAQLVLAKSEHERLEAERARKAVVERIVLTDVIPAVGDDPAIGLFRIGFTNSGTLDLKDAHLTILFVRGSASELLTGRWGGPESHESRDSTRERWPAGDGAPIDLDFVGKSVIAQRGIWNLQYVRVRRRGTFPIRVKLFHADLDGNGPWVDAWVHVDANGRTRIQNINAGKPDSVIGGRLDQLRDD